MIPDILEEILSHESKPYIKDINIQLFSGGVGWLITLLSYDNELTGHIYCVDGRIHFSIQPKGDFSYFCDNLEQLLNIYLRITINTFLRKENKYVSN